MSDAPPAAPTGQRATTCLALRVIAAAIAHLAVLGPLIAAPIIGT